MRIEEKKVDQARIIDVFNDFRIEDGLNWVKSLNATSHLLGISTDEIEEVLLDNQIYEEKDKKDKDKDNDNNAENILGKIMKKVSDGEDLTDDDKKVLKAALNTAKSGESGDEEKADKIMKKVSDGKSLTDEDKKFLSAIIDASKKSKKEETEIIVINEEIKLPNSDIILEKGDTIEIINHRV